jgi:DNA-damage-inducible protein J
MSKSVAVQARIEPNLKREADHIIHKLGLTASQVVNALYAQIVLYKAIPFELKLPNKATIEAMDELERGSSHVYSSVDAMFKDLDN